MRIRSGQCEPRSTFKIAWLLLVDVVDELGVAVVCHGLGVEGGQQGVDQDPDQNKWMHDLLGPLYIKILYWTPARQKNVEP